MTNNVLTSLEYFEKFGDTIVNMCINWWIPIVHPEIKSIGFADLILSSMKGSKYLGFIGIEKGWEDMVTVRKEDMQFLEDVARDTGANTKGEIRDVLRSMREYIKIYEDSIEAFFGTVVWTMMQDGKTFGTGVEVCFQIFFWMVSTTHFQGKDKPPGISLKPTDIAGPDVLLTDLYQQKTQGLRWGIESATERETVFGVNSEKYGRKLPNRDRWTIFH
jgi:hypothetical protein